MNLSNLLLLVEEFGNECQAAEKINQNGHKQVPPKGMFSFDGTKIDCLCAVNLHRVSKAPTPRLHYAGNRQIHLRPGPAVRRRPANRSR